MRRLVIATSLAAVLPFTPNPAQQPAPAAKPAADTARSKTDSLPLTPTRKVDFTTSDGTWLSLDVSPDGRTIVLELLGDLYTLAITGGTATRITSGPAFDSQPRYAPDGKHIVFLSDRSGAENIWICDADGKNAKPLTKGTNQLYASPVWTPTRASSPSQDSDRVSSNPHPTACDAVLKVARKPSPAVSTSRPPKRSSSARTVP